MSGSKRQQENESSNVSRSTKKHKGKFSISKKLFNVWSSLPNKCVYILKEIPTNRALSGHFLARQA